MAYVKAFNSSAVEIDSFFKGCSLGSIIGWFSLFSISVRTSLLSRVTLSSFFSLSAKSQIITLNL